MSNSLQSFVWGMTIARPLFHTMKIIFIVCFNLLFMMVLVYYGWFFFMPEKPVVNRSRKYLADIAIQRMLGQIKQNRQEIRKCRLLHFANDTTSYFSCALRKELDNSGILALDSATAWERLCLKLNVRLDGCSSQEDAFKEAGNTQEGILWGKLDQFETYNGETAIRGMWELLDCQTKACIFKGTIQEGSSPETTQTNEDSMTPFFQGKHSWAARTFIFIALMLLLPIVTFRWLRMVVSTRSNSRNAWTLGILTLADAVLAVFMFNGFFVSAGDVTLYVMVVALALLYNGRMMTFALNLEHGHA